MKIAESSNHKTHRKCERVITKNWRVEYCPNTALYISPPGVFTKRIIAVCNLHRKDLLAYHKYKAKTATEVSTIFIQISKMNIPAAKG